MLAPSRPRSAVSYCGSYTWCLLLLLQGANAFEAVWLVLVLTVLLMAARAAFVVPFSLLHNCWSAPTDRLNRRDVVIVWWAGLMRGVCQAYHDWDGE